MRRYGLIGRNVSYSFSPGYFREKFNELGLEDCFYEIFDLPDLNAFSELFVLHPDIRGLNVTIPYKELILPYLHYLDPEAKSIGAVNTIRISGHKLEGYNTDVTGFKESLIPLLRTSDLGALVLGTGGASKAVAYGLKQLGISCQFVSRRPGPGLLTYSDIDAKILAEHSILINCTPLGTYPEVEAAPPIPYSLLNPSHLLYDLIYNPNQTKFLQYGAEKGTRTKNGLEMLQLQADASWNLWNS